MLTCLLPTNKLYDNNFTFCIYLCLMPCLFIFLQILTPISFLFHSYSPTGHKHPANKTGPRVMAERARAHAHTHTLCGCNPILPQAETRGPQTPKPGPKSDTAGRLRSPRPTPSPHSSPVDRAEHEPVNTDPSDGRLGRSQRVDFTAPSVL